ncbi:Transcriptional regulator, AraC family [[Actinomadura] parvosata subsp. kistnae]|uniref:AraC family transcriptional regulator n=1 Tax=[Actinomadura] parvosata subsp. kistnae TaxID=1909395 RepID=A0A1V0A1G1_9ACTN|nr:AraC family transcriptional regulator [Nonomuraea sp. ATCC 55076]AQZ64027.1 AraC family transcriptional regulator [Nonomuraea sp. ATCC 55076]SPL89910.1 Transcriptional regulator, AraC family [Actinomadura parvosata subsp. kistnae]
MEPLTFDSRDLGQTEEFLSKAYARMSIGSDVAGPRTRISREVLGSISVDRLWLEYAMSYDVHPLGKVCLCVVESGSIVQQVAGQEEEVFGPGDAVLFAPPDRPHAGEIRRSRYTIVMFDDALLQSVAGTSPEHGPGPVRLVGHRPVSAAAGLHLQRTIAYLRDDVLGNAAVAGEPLVASAAGQLLAASVLTALPSTAATDAASATTGADRHDAHSQTLRRAIAFIEERAGTPIGIDDIAAAARVSARALQYAFRQHLGTTPLGYLRQARLARAHAELLAGDPAATTVAAVAARWGFFHPGRFALSYKAAYGRAPSDTLRALAG